MNQEELLKLAENIRDGKATEQEKLQFLQSINLELDEIYEILKKAPHKNKN